MHFREAGTQIANGAVPHRQGEKHGLMAWEVLMEAGEAFEEAPTPCAAPTPLAEGAETPVAGVNAPKESLPALRPLRGDLHRYRRRAIADRLGDVQRFGVHCQVVADG